MAGYGNLIPSHFQQQEKSSLEAATEAAAKVNAMLIAKGKLRPNQIHNTPQNQKKPNQSSMVAAEVEINDAPLSMRNMLTRGPTQEEITKFSGAAVSTRGRYMAPSEKMKNNSGERPLYLFVQGPNQDSVNVAVARINEILTGGKGGMGSGGGLVRTSGGGPPPLPSIPTQPPPPGPGLLPMPNIPGMPNMQMPPVNQPPPMFGAHMPPPEFQQITVLEEKLFIGLEHAPPSFDVKGKMLGPGSSYLAHIQVETGAKVVLKGKGSGYIEPSIGRETMEPMHIMIQHPSMVGLQQAKQLAENLIQTVQQMYASFQQALASMPSAVAPGPTAYITGLQQPSSLAEAAMMGPPPGMTAINAMPEAQLVHSATGLQQQTVMVPSSSMSSVMMPAGSMASSLAGLSHGQHGASLMLPTTLSLAPVPYVSTLSISNPGSLQLQPPPGALDLGQQQLIMSQGPSPQQLGQVNLAPQMTMSVQSSVPMSMASLASLSNHLASQPNFNPAHLQPTVQLVSQPPQAPPGMGPPHIPGPVPAPNQPPPFQLYNPQDAVSSSGVVWTSAPPASLVFSSAGPNSHIYSVATSSTTVSQAPTSDTEPMARRRFTEEKEEKIPDNLLGYQHGPPHLVNLVCSSPPPNQGQPGHMGQGQQLLQQQVQLGLPPQHSQAQGLTLMPGQPGMPPQPGMPGGGVSYQPASPHQGLQQSLPPGHPGVPNSFTMQPGLQVQAIYSMPTQLPPPPVSQGYSMSPIVTIPSEDGRYMTPVSNAGGMMQPPPPPVSSSGGDPMGQRQLMPPPSAPSPRPEGQSGQQRQSGGIKRGFHNGDRAPDIDRIDRKRRKENGSEDEDKGGRSPSSHRESPKPGNLNQGNPPRSQSYSPVQRDGPPQEGLEGMPPPPPPGPPPQAYQTQFDGAGQPPQHLMSLSAPYNPNLSPFEHAGHPPPPPMQQHFMEHGGQPPPPPPIQYQELAHQYPPGSGPQGQPEMAQFHHHPQAAPHNQAEFAHHLPPPPGPGMPPPHSELGHPYGAMPAVSQGEPQHAVLNYPPFSQSFCQPSPQPQYINTPPASSHSSFPPNSMFLPQVGRPPHPGLPPPPPPPPPSSQYQHAPPQGYWHG